MKHYVFKRYIRNDLTQEKKIVFYPYGAKSWLLNDQYHNEDGPTFEWRNGDKEWWLNNKRYAKKRDYLKALKEYKFNKSKRAF